MRPELTIVAEDEDYLFIDKPAGLRTIPDRFDPALPNLLDMLKHRHDPIFVVHRLDKPTSGIIVFARNADAHRALTIALEHREVDKQYHAVLTGSPRDPEGVIELPIGENPARPGSMRVDHRSGKPAVTHYRVVEAFRGFTLVEAQPRSGRTHQLRVHFAAIGCPLPMDELYGNAAPILLSSWKPHFKRKPDRPERSLIQRLPLHAARVEFTHFRTGQRVSAEAPWPKDFSALLKQLRKHLAADPASGPR